MSKCPECGGIHETPTLEHKTDWECLQNQLATAKAEIERQRNVLQDICNRYCGWYDKGEFYTGASDAAYGLYMTAAHGLSVQEGFNQEAAKAE